MKGKDRVVSVRLPGETYLALLEKSRRWKSSVSSIMRSFAIEHLTPDDKIRDQIKSYKKENPGR